MSKNRGVDVKYKCWHDCQQNGCPGHTVRMDYSNTADVMIFEFDCGTRMLFDPDQWKAMKEAERLSDEANR